MILRHPHSKDNPYFMLNRKACDDINLSLKALGLHTYLMSKPDSWNVNVKQLATRFKCGQGLIRTCLKELKENGYTQISQAHDHQGRITNRELLVYEVPLEKGAGTILRKTASKVNPNQGEVECIVSNVTVVSNEEERSLSLPDDDDPSVVVGGGGERDRELVSRVQNAIARMGGGLPGGGRMEMAIEMAEEYGIDAFELACKAAYKQDTRSLNYIEAVLRNPRTPKSVVPKKIVRYRTPDGTIVEREE